MQEYCSFFFFCIHVQAANVSDSSLLFGQHLEIPCTSGAIVGNVVRLIARSDIRNRAPEIISAFQSSDCQGRSSHSLPLSEEKLCFLEKLSPKPCYIQIQSLDIAFNFGRFLSQLGSLHSLPYLKRGFIVFCKSYQPSSVAL